MPRWRWILTQFTRRLWVRATLIGLLGVVAAILATVAERLIPWEIPVTIGADAVDRILYIIASSMLAVTTFSLSVMTSAYGAATSHVTPRATKLLIADRVTQNVLSTFIGSFLFGIVGIVALKIGAYGPRGRVILFAVTIGVIVLIVASLLRWIDHLTRLGRVGETTDEVEKATRAALDERWHEPYLGGAPLPDPARDIPAKSVAVPAGVVGYVQHVDLAALEHACGEAGARLYMLAIPGTFVYPDTPVARLVTEAGPEEEGVGVADAVRRAFSIGTERSFDQDPRFGLAVMGEIASRALSPALNDHGTAIDVIGRLARLLAPWARPREADAGFEAPAVRFPRVHVPPLSLDDLFEDAFMLIARDGAGRIEVQLRIQKALGALARLGDGPFRAAALRQAGLARARAEEALMNKADMTRLRDTLERFAAE